MGFIQIIEFSTDDIDKHRALLDEVTERVGDRGTVRRGILCADRKQPGKYVSVVFFDSYESAMVNSDLPEVQEFAASMAAASNGAPVFHDLDVLEDITVG